MEVSTMGINTSPGPATKRTRKKEFTEQVVGHTLPSHRFRRHPSVTRVLREAEARKFERVARMHAAGHLTVQRGMLWSRVTSGRAPITRDSITTIVQIRRNDRMTARWIKMGWVLAYQHEDDVVQRIMSSRENT